MAPGAAAVVLGYRIGMLTSGAGALYLASVLPWSLVYTIMAALVGVGLITMLLNREPEIRVSPESTRREADVAAFLERRPGLAGWRAELLAWLFGAVVAPFADFMTRRAWVAILLFIAIYKLGDVYAGAMATPFYLELGFSKIEIANVTKAFGLGASIIGGLLGGVVVSRFGVMRSLLVCGVLQMVSNLMFVLLARSGHDIGMLTVVIAVENVTGGMGTGAFVAYLSSLCNVAYTATQYALLSSFSAVGRDFLAASSGWLADRMDWVAYYLLSTSAALPGLLLLLWLMRRQSREGRGGCGRRLKGPVPLNPMSAAHASAWSGCAATWTPAGASSIPAWGGSGGGCGGVSSLRAATRSGAPARLHGCVPGFGSVGLL